MTNDPVVHDHALNEAFRSEIPRKPEPMPGSGNLMFVTVVPKYTSVRGIQITEKNIEDIALKCDYPADRGNSMRYLVVPGITGDVRAYINDWILIADDNWDIVTVCGADAFTRNYEVQA